MIDRTTGAVSLGPQMLGADTSEEDFVSSPSGETASKEMKNRDWSRYSIDLAKVSLTLLFAKRKLVELRLALKQAADGGWDSWSLESERKRKSLHDTWLLEQLGEPPYEFAWGDIESIFDERAGASMIVLRYRT